MEIEITMVEIPLGIRQEIQEEQRLLTIETQQDVT